MKTTLTALALVAAAGTASAELNTFSLPTVQDATSVISLDVVRAAGNGTVEIRDFNGGELGAILGTKTVNAGVNKDVRVNVGGKPIHDVVAVLIQNGEPVAMQEVEIRNN